MVIACAYGLNPSYPGPGRKGSVGGMMLPAWFSSLSSTVNSRMSRCALWHTSVVLYESAILAGRYSPKASCLAHSLTTTTSLSLGCRNLELGTTRRVPAETIRATPKDARTSDEARERF
jgi:hypothetical protein